MPVQSVVVQGDAGCHWILSGLKSDRMAKQTESPKNIEWFPYGLFDGLLLTEQFLHFYLNTLFIYFTFINHKVFYYIIRN